MIEFLNSINNFFDILNSNILKLTSTILCSLNAWSRGISLEKKNKFYGITKFKKANKATIKIGANCSFRSKHTSNLIGINHPCIFSALMPNARLIVGDNCGFSGTVIGCFQEIIIGNNVRCGANTLITDADWHLHDPRASTPMPIIIEDNVWLGVNVTVMKGVKIGENSVIGAGSIVTSNIPANVIAAGNPCKVLKQLI